jgi:predicted metal-binding membrane protein
MATARATLPRPARLGPRGLALRHPELGAAAVVAAAWVTLVVLAARAGGLSAAATGGMAGMSMGGPAARSAWSTAAAGLPSWMLMTVAMMGPAALASVGHTGRSSLAWRRRRAMAEFSAAYLAVWAAFGLLAQAAAAAAVPAVPGPAALAAVLAAATAWQLTPLKRRCLIACHRAVPLPPRGWRAEKGALRFGLRNGLSCLGSCWCLMLVMTVAPGGQLLWTAGLTGVVTAERLARRPRHAARTAAAALAFATVATLAVGNLLR